MAASPPSPPYSAVPARRDGKGGRGTVTSGTDADLSSCKQCAKGRFAKVEGQAVCDDCVEGKSSSTTGKSACAECGAGNVTVTKCASAALSSCTARTIAVEYAYENGFITTQECNKFFQEGTVEIDVRMAAQT